MNCQNGDECHPPNEPLQRMPMEPEKRNGKPIKGEQTNSLGSYCQSEESCYPPTPHEIEAYK